MPFYHGLKYYTDDPARGDYPGKSDWIARRLLALRYDLGQAIVNDRRPGSLIIGSWNIRAFDGGLPRRGGRRVGPMRGCGARGVRFPRRPVSLFAPL